MLKRDFSDIVYRALANYFDVQVINSNIKRTGKKIVFVDATSSTTVAAGDYEVIEITPADGKAWRIEAARIYCLPPSGATTGYHRFYINFNLLSLSTDYLMIQNAYNYYIDVRGSPTRYSAIEPSDESLWWRMLTHPVFTPSRPLKIRYENGTDADQTNPRYILLLVEEYDEVS